jgi:gliding motility-associatede transport system auxiliary component
LSGRIQAWLAFVLSLAAVLAIAVALQAYAELFNRRFDMTAENRLSLSPYTLSVLGQVEEPLRVDLYYRRGERQRARDLLELMRDHCRELSFELVDLDRNPGRAKDHGVDHYDRAVVFYQGREVVVSAGSEETLTGGIAKVLHEKPRVLYFVTGHRERTIAAGKGDQYGRAAQILRNEGFEVRTLSLLQARSVPADASAVVIAGPEVDLVESEIEKLDLYLAGGGGVLVLVDPTELPVLTAWLARRGVTLRDDVVIDRTNRVYGTDGTNVIVPFYRDHDATRPMDVPGVLGRARSVALTNGGDDDAETGASIVARTANESFAAADASRTRQGEVEFDAARDVAGPVGVMAAAYTGGTAEKRGRLVVVGDADFPSDSYLALLGNKDLLVNTIGWLVADRATGARPHEEASKLGPMSPVYVSDEQSRVILATAVVLQPLVFLVAGVVVVVVRRRRR